MALADDIAAVTASIAAIDAKLITGIRRVDEVGRSVLLDLPSLRQERAELVTRLAKLNGTVPTVRHLLPLTMSKGL